MWLAGQAVRAFQAEAQVKQLHHQARPLLQRKGTLLLCVLTALQYTRVVRWCIHGVQQQVIDLDAACDAQLHILLQTVVMTSCC